MKQIRPYIPLLALALALFSCGQRLLAAARTQPIEQKSAAYTWQNLKAAYKQKDDPQVLKIVKAQPELINELKYHICFSNRTIIVTMMHQACFDGRTSLVAMLLDLAQQEKLKLSTQCTTPASHGMAPQLQEVSFLHMAACEGHNDLIQTLLQRCSDKAACLNARSYENTTPLLLAIKARHQSTVELLLQEGSDISLCAEEGESALNMAIYAWRSPDKSLNLVETVFNALVRHQQEQQPELDETTIKRKLLNPQDSTHTSPLILACRKGEYCNPEQLVSYLIASGADPNHFQDRNIDATPLATALSSNPALVHLLLQHGASAEQAYRQSLAKRHRISLLFQACEKGHLELVEAILQRTTAELNEPHTSWGMTPLHAATYRGRNDVVHLLLRYGASPTVLDNNTDFPLMAACANCSLDVVKLLTPRFIQLASITSPKNPLWEALEGQNLPVVGYLLEQGCNPNATRSNNPHSHDKDQTPLDCALEKNNSNLVALLCRHKAQPAVTHVAKAIKNKSNAQVQALINAGADVTHTDQKGHTLLHLTAAVGSNDALTYLLSLPQGLALIDTLTGEEETALHIAAGKQHEECVRILIEHGAQQLPTGTGTSIKKFARIGSNHKIFLSGTPLFYAACDDNEAIFSMLIPHAGGAKALNAEIKIPLPHGERYASCVYFAWLYGSPAILKKALEAGGEITHNPYSNDLFWNNTSDQEQAKHALMLDRGIFGVITNIHSFQRVHTSHRSKLLYASHSLKPAKCVHALLKTGAYHVSLIEEKQYQESLICNLLERLVLLAQLDCNALEGSCHISPTNEHPATTKAPKRLPAVIITEIISKIPDSVKAICALTAYSGKGSELPINVIKRMTDDTYHSLRKYKPTTLKQLYRQLTAGANRSMLKSIGSLVYEKTIAGKNDDPSDTLNLLKGTVAFYLTQQTPTFSNNKIVAQHLHLLHLLATLDPTKYTSYEQLLADLPAKICEHLIEQNSSTLRTFIEDMVELMLQPPRPRPSFLPKQPQKLIDDLTCKAAKIMGANPCKAEGTEFDQASVTSTPSVTDIE